MKCSACINEENKEDMWYPQFNRYLCESCWTYYRCNIEEMFDLNSLQDADELLNYFNFKKWIKKNPDAKREECRT